ncbi:MAG: ABC transporter ATP-binding protein [Candidatus Woesearchaeota archaeon]
MVVAPQGTVSFSVEHVEVRLKNFSMKEVNFSLNKGDILGLVGQSGSGKSTLLRTLIGEYKPVKGQIIALVDGQKVLPSRIVGYSPQDNALFPYLTLEENILTFGELHGLSRAECKKRMVNVLADLHLLGSEKKRITQLSGGMQKRADLAVTLIHDPKVVVLDEPFNGLDISLQKFLWEILRKLASRGTIIIVSSHFLADIQVNCNKYGLIHKGVYYNTQQIVKTIKNHATLEAYLQSLFSEQ